MGAGAHRADRSYFHASNVNDIGRLRDLPRNMFTNTQRAMIGSRPLISSPLHPAARPLGGAGGEGAQCTRITR